MIKYIVFLLTIFSSYVIAGESFDIGSQLPAEAIDRDVFLMISPSQFRKSYEIEIDGIKFSVCPNEEGKVVYIATSNSKFSTPEGIHVGDTYEKVQNISDRHAVKLRGWAFVVPLPSGWKAAFTQGKTMTEGELVKDSKVVFIFKGNG